MAAVSIEEQSAVGAEVEEKAEVLGRLRQYGSTPSTEEKREGSG